MNRNFALSKSLALLVATTVGFLASECKSAEITDVGRWVGRLLKPVPSTMLVRWPASAIPLLVNNMPSGGRTER
jgi:hypothetical protein